MIKFLKVLQVFKPWESLIKVNEEFKIGVKIKAVGNVKEKNYYSAKKKIQEEPQGTDANHHQSKEPALASAGSDLESRS